ncbi:MAG TPA: NifB/NifX family molybdenum-iron cluster-binding protein [Melioribacteraceae bacterium]|nr:NifB/NifX family molybdenum-iron cluster-binding protein [Melioribacteraceae bacterium]
MKIAFCAVEGSIESLLSRQFGRSNFFIFYDTNLNTYSILPNPICNSVGGAGIQTAQFIISQNVDVVVSGKIGDNAVRFLKLANINIITDCSGKVKEIIPNLRLDNINKIGA